MLPGEEEILAGGNGKLAIFSSREIKSIVEDMRELFSQSRVAFLFGAGCSLKAGLPLMGGLTQEVYASDKVTGHTEDLFTAIREAFSGSGNPTIEDYMSEVVDLLSIADRRSKCGATAAEVTVGGNSYPSSDLEKSLAALKQAIASCIRNKRVDVSYHRHFTRAIHGSLQAGKNPRTVDYFIMNYDTLVEDALGLEKIAYIDGFRGGATGWWDPAIFKNENAPARVFKLHGSIDWCLLEGDSVPRRIRERIQTDTDPNHVLIYPAATKYQETQRDPFAQLLRHMRQSLCPIEGKEMVLGICGYKFGDSHVDLEIENALYQSEGRLTVAAFIEQDEPRGKLEQWLDSPVVCDQIRVYSNRYYIHGTKRIAADRAIPWWKFEVLARVLGGER